MRGFAAPGAGEPRRADAVGVGAADAVGVVVRVVDADLQHDGDREAEQRCAPSATPVSVTRNAAPLPSATGAIASGRVRMRAPPTQSPKVAFCTTTRGFLPPGRPLFDLRATAGAACLALGLAAAFGGASLDREDFAEAFAAALTGVFDGSMRCCTGFLLATHKYY